MSLLYANRSRARSCGFARLMNFIARLHHLLRTWPRSLPRGRASGLSHQGGEGEKESAPPRVSLPECRRGSRCGTRRKIAFRSRRRASTTIQIAGEAASILPRRCGHQLPIGKTPDDESPLSASEPCAAYTLQRCVFLSLSLSLSLSRSLSVSSEE